MTYIGRSETWDGIVSYYEELVTEYSELEPQTELLKRIAESDYASHLYASTSHGALCLSTACDYSTRRELPMVCVQYVGNQIFEVQYHASFGKTHDIIKRKCGSAEVWNVLESYFIRLKLESQPM